MANNLYEVIEGEYGKPLITDILKNKKLLTSDDYVIEVLFALYDVFYEQIHNYLAPKKSKESEAEIKSHLAFISSKILPLIETKFSNLGKEADKLIRNKKTSTMEFKKCRADFEKYEELYDDYYALVAFRSFKHYVLYLEMDFPNKVFEPAKHCFEGYWYYATKMVVDGDVQFLEAQCPTGYGKSVSSIALIAFIYGQDINNDVLKITGAKGNISREFESIIGFLCSKQHAKVFPYFQQFEGRKDKLFELCSLSSGSFKIRGSKRPKNFYFVSKEVDTNGERAKYLFLDDITQAMDAGNIKIQDKEIQKFNNEWFKRNYDQTNFYICVSGTTYSEYDLLSYLKKEYGSESAVQSKINKYTYVAKSNALVQKGTSCFVVVPKLDYETDESTYPTKFPTENARKMRDKDERMFAAMEQQQPLPPEGTPFYWDNLTQYEVLPKIGEEGRTQDCYAVIDPARKGKNYVAMPIVTAIGSKYYLVDFLYELKPMSEVYSGIVSKVVQHHIVWLVIENNTDTSLKALIQKKLAEQGVDFCTVTDVYSIGEKDVRIFNQEATIKNNIVFPHKDMYARSSPMGKALMHIIAYSYTKKNDYDDSIDSLALMSQHIIQARKGKNKIKIIKRNKRLC